MGGTPFSLVAPGWPGVVGQSGGAPSWVPKSNGVVASSYADFTSEGGTNHYWHNRAKKDNAAAWIAARSGTFTRASIATYANSAGAIVSAASGELRFDYSPTSLVALGVRLEGARTNLCLQSQAFDNASWSLARVTCSANAVTAPDGTATQDRLVETAEINTHGVFQPITIVNTTVYSRSVFGKAAERNWLAIDATNGGAGVKTWFDLTAGAVGTSAVGNTGSIVGYPGGIWRAAVTRTSSGTTGFHQLNLGRTDNETGTYLGDITKGLSVWGAQLELGAFSSSYIPATTASVTRAADSLTRTRSSPAAISMTIAGRAAPGVSGNQVLWQIDDGSEVNRIRAVRNTSGELHVIATVSSSDVADLNLGALASGADFSVAFRAGANDFAAALNGGSLVTDVSGAMPAGLVNERIGADSAGNQWFGTVASIAEF